METSSRYRVVEFESTDEAAAFVAALSRYLYSPQGRESFMDADPVEVWSAFSATEPLRLYLSDGAYKAANFVFRPVLVTRLVGRSDLPPGLDLVIEGLDSPALGMDEARRHLEAGGSESLTRRVIVRAAVPADAPAIAGLIGELGYPSTTEEITERLGALQGIDYAVQVAERGGIVVGLLSLHRMHTLHISAPTCYLTALVTAAAARRSGVGRQLLAAADSWARANGCSRLVLTTANHRQDAHDFYRANGFALTGLRFIKNLD